jgi:hypothetical protein
MAQKFNFPFGGEAPKKAAPKRGPGPMAAQGEMGEGGQEPEDGAEIAAQHGPAHEVHITHEEEMGSHHVHSMHPDGHEHHSDHASKEEAHEHGKKLAGVGAEGAQQEPDGDEGGMLR